MAKAGKGRWDADKRGQFLSGVAGGATQTAALAAVGLSLSSLKRQKRADAAFAARCVAAMTAKAAGAAQDALASRAATTAGTVPKTRRDPRRLGVEAEARFFATLAGTANVRAAAEAAGVSNRTVYDRRQSDPIFRLRWLATVDEAMADLHLEMIEKARAALAGQGPRLAAGDERIVLALLARHRGTASGASRRAGDASVLTAVETPAAREAANDAAAARLMAAMTAERARLGLEADYGSGP